MAQKREKDETDLKLPENFFRASPMPSLPKPSAAAEDPISRSPEPVDPPLLDHPIRKVSNADESRSCSSLKSPETPDLSAPPHLTTTATSTSPEKSEVKRREINRCSGCRRKVGLTGFRCRCGEMFCREHRYSDRHDCSFDYKAAGREAIARENPLVRASKILKV